MFQAEMKSGDGGKAGERRGGWKLAEKAPRAVGNRFGPVLTSGLKPATYKHPLWLKPLDLPGKIEERAFDSALRPVPGRENRFAQDDTARQNTAREFAEAGAGAWRETIIGTA
jgi:hypothetical protein